MTFDPRRVDVDHKKNKVIQRWPTPKNVRSFFNNKIMFVQNKVSPLDLKANPSQERGDDD